MKTSSKPVILLVAEAVTLAHFGRIVSLANALDLPEYEVVIAADPRYAGLAAAPAGVFHPIRSISSEQFARALAHGKPIYSVPTLSQYVEDDLDLLAKVKPDLVIGDFRLSLAVSAPLRKIPYASVVNAYWSPFANIEYPVPDLTITRVLGVHLAQRLFTAIRPMVFAVHARPLNAVRQRYGLPSLGPDLRNVYTWGDYTLYADIPEVAPTRDLPSNHQYLGPVFWSANIPLPDWWSSLPEDKPVIFLTLGSSGEARILPMVIATLSRLPLTIIVATAGKTIPTVGLADAYIADYLPVDLAIRRSRIVISNGGSLTTYQALARKVPVIGLCSNMDQLLNMGAVEDLGAGLRLRATEVSPSRLLSAVSTLLDNPCYAEAAGRVGQILAHTDSTKRFRDVVATILHKRNNCPQH